PYSITVAGRIAFAAWIKRRPGPETIRFTLLLTVAFGRHLTPAQLADVLGHHRGIHEARLARYAEQQAAEEAGDDIDTFALATLDFGRTYERAVLDWLDRLPASITNPS
ncbi:MAG: PadR family transcriptional regulator, partial [Mycobacteriales bacterium]